MAHDAKVAISKCQYRAGASMHEHRSRPVLAAHRDSGTTSQAAVQMPFSASRVHHRCLCTCKSANFSKGFIAVIPSPHLISHLRMLLKLQSCSLDLELADWNKLPKLILEVDVTKGKTTCQDLQAHIRLVLWMHTAAIR